MSQIVIIIYLYITSQFVVLKTWLVYKCTFIIYCFDKTFWKKAHFRRKSHHNFVLGFFEKSNQNSNSSICRIFWQKRTHVYLQNLSINLWQCFSFLFSFHLVKLWIKNTINNSFFPLLMIKKNQRHKIPLLIS